MVVKIGVDEVIVADVVEIGADEVIVVDDFVVEIVVVSDVAKI